MYERFYQLRNRPFALSPDPDFLYPSRVHREALDYLRFGIEGHAGFVVVTGEIGSGKTTLLQVLLRSLDGQTTVIRIVNTLLTGAELLEAMLLDLGVRSLPMSKPAMVRELARLLISERAHGRRVVAIIDEAQNLSLAALEELRMLSNLETEKSKLIQIVLVGQPDLRTSLDLPSLEQLRQRVTVRYHLGPLDAGETAAYINHRLARAAAAAPLEFSRGVTDLVHARSGGMPRMINVICDAALLVGYAENVHAIDVPLMQMAISELETSTVLRRKDATTSAATAASSAPAIEQSAPTLREPPHAAPQHTVPVARVATAAAAAGPAAPLDTRLRQPSAAPDLPVRPRLVQTPPKPQQWTLQRSQMAHLAPPATRVTARVQPPTEKQPEPTADADSRRTGGWGWVKTILLGFDPEAERR